MQSFPCLLPRNTDALFDRGEMLTAPSSTDGNRVWWKLALKASRQEAAYHAKPPPSTNRLRCSLRTNIQSDFMMVLLVSPAAPASIGVQQGWWMCFTLQPQSCRTGSLHMNHGMHSPEARCCLLLGKGTKLWLLHRNGACSEGLGLPSLYLQYFSLGACWALQSTVLCC